ncbi:leucine-rich repeat-containing protein 57 [Plakobranchus ocellatus]|uniref:Leucine-rich repeat-containing protein 57 n=1 Tax=Plakobranchus ocellatus TaxID=259542 RepID=A0AAV4DZF0_9GAST|nr:leucine-rich repeat-containing protein 57 [Plakobranchus ocellatus]
MLCCCKRKKSPELEIKNTESSLSNIDSVDSGVAYQIIMGNSNLKQHIDTAQKTGACQLRRLNLKEVPEELQKLAKMLRTVDLSDNKIPQLPPWFVTFASLKNLTMNNCRLLSLPENFGQLRKLEVLSLSGNSLTHLPPSVSHLVNLKTLTLSGNLLTAFPAELLNLQQLDCVDLSSNKISDLPQNMASLQAVEVNLNHNQVSYLPESIAQCPRLKVLRLEENSLDISALTPNILKNSQISLFAVEGNLFDMKAFHHLEGYDEYMERFTATKRKFN